MIEAKWHPDREELGRFGKLAITGFITAGFLTAWRNGAFSGEQPWSIPIAVWSAGVIVFALAWLAPKTLLPVYWLLYGAGWLFFTVIGYFAMTLIFVFLLTPIAILFRLTGRDALQCKLDPAAESYWITSNLPRPRDHYFRQS